MAAKFTVIDDEIKISFEYQADATKVQDIVGACAEYLFEHGYGDHGTEEEPIVFEDLNNNQKLSLLDKHIRDVILNLANTHKSLKAQDLARETEEQNKFDL